MQSIEKFVNIEGKNVHYYESSINNARDTLLLLHGKSFKAETWLSINTDTRLNKIGISTIAVDYPGWGLSEENKAFWPPDDKYSNTAIFIKKFADEIGLKKFSLLGASFSGPFIVAFAHNNPERINKLLFIGTVWSEELTDYVKDINKKSLIIYGANDTVIPPEASKKYKEYLKNNEFYTIKDAKHAMYLDKPDEFFRILNDFL